MDIDLNPDGPHSPEHTAEVGDLFDQCSHCLTYATMAEKHGLEYPADAYRLLGEIYSATARLPQLCGQLTAFLPRRGTQEGSMKPGAATSARRWRGSLPPRPGATVPGPHQSR